VLVADVVDAADAADVEAVIVVIAVTMATTSLLSKTEVLLQRAAGVFLYLDVLSTFYFYKQLLFIILDKDFYIE
jgi:hypothetical protein